MDAFTKTAAKADARFAISFAETRARGWTSGVEPGAQTLAAGVAPPLPNQRFRPTGRDHASNHRAKHRGLHRSSATRRDTARWLLVEDSEQRNATDRQSRAATPPSRGSERLPNDPATAVALGPPGYRNPSAEEAATPMPGPAVAVAAIPVATPPSSEPSTGVVLRRNLPHRPPL